MRYILLKECSFVTGLVRGVCVGEVDPLPNYFSDEVVSFERAHK